MNAIHIIKFIIVIFAICGGIYSLIMHKASDTAKKRILFVWLLAPPISFWLEYYFHGLTLTGDDLEHFKALQDHGSKIWAGFATILTISFFKSDSTTSSQHKEEQSSKN